MSETITLQATQQHALRIPLNEYQQPVNGDVTYGRESFPDVMYRAEQILVAADTGTNGLNNRSFEAHLAYGVMQKIERQTAGIAASEAGAAYADELEARKRGFSSAGFAQTGLEAPVSYRRIAEIAEVLIDASQHSVASADKRVVDALPSLRANG